MDYEVNVKNMGADGEFVCPKCGEFIFPEDESVSYKVLDEVGECSRPDYIVIKHVCGAEIKVWF